MIETSPKLYTIRGAANKLGIQYRQLLDGVNQKKIPHYRIQNSRRLLRLDEVLAVTKQGVEGGVSND